MIENAPNRIIMHDCVNDLIIRNYFRINMDYVIKEKARRRRARCKTKGRPLDDILLTEKLKLTDKARKSGRRMITHLWRYRSAMGLGLLCTVLATLLNSAAIILIKLVIDRALDGRDMRMLALICGAIIVSFLLKGVFSYARTMLVTWSGMKMVEDLRNDAHTSIQAMSLGYFEKQRSGELMSRLMNDTGMIQMFVTSTVAEAVMIPVGIISCFAVVIYLSAKLTILSMIMSPIIIVAISLAGRRMKRLSHSVMEKLADLQALLFEILSAMNVVKAFHTEKYEIKRFADENCETVRVTMKQANIRALYTPLVELIGATCLAILFWMGGSDVIHQTPDFITGKVLTKGDIIAMFVGLQQLFTSFNRVNQVNLSFQHSFASAERVYQIVDLQPDVQEKPDAVDIKDLHGRVEFKNVAFEYNPSEPVLKDVSFVADQGTVVALVGSSGAGKTTIVKLVPRFYDVSGGSIHIDDVDLRDATFSSYRTHIGIVPQETILFRGSIRDNIAYGRQDATNQEIEDAARAAYAHEFIEKMPNGYDTQVGEHGATLSGGQRQRIAIARAILKDPRILILDEATSNVDSVSEKFIQEALDKLMKGRTTFVVAHRLSTIKNADLILVMERGRILERGRHDELYQAGGVYRKLYESTLASHEAAGEQESSHDA